MPIGTLSNTNSRQTYKADYILSYQYKKVEFFSRVQPSPGNGRNETLRSLYLHKSALMLNFC